MKRCNVCRSAAACIKKKREEITGKMQMSFKREAS